MNYPGPGFVSEPEPVPHDLATDACPHPEDQLEPLPYMGKPADPDEWECRACGMWQMKDEPRIAAKYFEADVFDPAAYETDPARIKEFMDRTILPISSVVDLYDYTATPTFKSQSITEIFRQLLTEVVISDKIRVTMAASVARHANNLRTAIKALEAFRVYLPKELAVDQATSPHAVSADVRRMLDLTRYLRPDTYLWRMPRRVLFWLPGSDGMPVYRRDFRLYGCPVVLDDRLDNNVQLVVSVS